ncbi:MAG: plasmid pRiA4b ORF-3 family protein [Pseudonocardia sp.]|nr:plasmid pRiA4b ORF-3 family protein [Pseudonocardia sp.]
MADTQRAQTEARTASMKTVHTIKITLRSSRPPIWRRLEVPSRMSLDQLHDIIQVSFGWGNYHMWDFETAMGRYGEADPDLEILSAASRTLDDVLPSVGDRLRYTYDFGDSWEHDVLVEAISPASPGTAYPRCVTGRRACPPEDCGGIWGYVELLHVLADPGHENHEHRLRWLGLDSADQFDPEAFDLDQTNRNLAGLAQVLVTA